jgi:hypothetical protein
LRRSPPWPSQRTLAGVALTADIFATVATHTRRGLALAPNMRARCVTLPIAERSAFIGARRSVLAGPSAPL